MSTIDIGLNIFCGAFLFTILAHALYKDYWTRKLFGVVEGIPIILPPAPPTEVQEVGLSDESRQADEYVGELIELESKAYSRYIILKNSSLEFLRQRLLEHADLTGEDEMQLHKFQLAEVGELQILKLPETISFDRYHDFATWFMFTEKRKSVTESCLGMAYHNSNM